LVHVHCPISVCEERDVKGMYAKARAGEIKSFTGIDAPFVPPPSPDVKVDTSEDSVEECVQQILDALLPWRQEE